MSAPIERPATPERLFLWVMHRFAEEFREHAILKGGMALRLVDSPRFTTDLDYVFAPFASKEDVRESIEGVLRSLSDARVDVRAHSRMLRAELHLDEASIQVEVNVAQHCDSIPMSTGALARALGEPPHVVRVMSPPWALAHKLAAWNERRLLRDLFDATFFVTRLGVFPAREILQQRLERVDSRVGGARALTLRAFAGLLRAAVGELRQSDFESELGALLSPADLAGLEVRVRAAMSRVADFLEAEE